MLLVVYVLLFIGFKSFSDPSDGTHSFQLRSITATLPPRTAIAGIVNTCLAVGAAVAVNRSERSLGDEASARVEEAAQSISDKVKDVLDMVAPTNSCSVCDLVTLQAEALPVATTSTAVSLDIANLIAPTFPLESQLRLWRLWFLRRVKRRLLQLR